MIRKQTIILHKVMSYLSISNQYDLVARSCQEIEKSLGEGTPTWLSQIQSTITSWQHSDTKDLNDRVIVVLGWEAQVSLSGEMLSLKEAVIGLEFLLFSTLSTEVPKNTEPLLLEWVSSHYQSQVLEEENGPVTSLAHICAKSHNSFIRRLTPLCIEKGNDPYAIDTNGYTPLDYLVVYEETDLLISLIETGHRIDIDYALSLFMSERNNFVLSYLIIKKIISLDTLLSDGTPLWYYLIHNLDKLVNQNSGKKKLVHYVLKKLYTIKKLDYQDSKNRTTFTVLISLSPRTIHLNKQILLNYIKRAVVAGLFVPNNAETDSFIASLRCEDTTVLTEIDTEFYLKLIRAQLILPGSQLFFDLWDSEHPLSLTIREFYRYNNVEIGLLRQFLKISSLLKYLYTPLAERIALKHDLEGLLDQLSSSGFSNCQRLFEYLEPHFNLIQKRENEIDEWIALYKNKNPVFDPIGCSGKELAIDRISQALAKGEFDLALAVYKAFDFSSSTYLITKQVFHFLLQSAAADITEFNGESVFHAALIFLEALSKMEKSLDDRIAFYGNHLIHIKELISRLKKTIAYTAYFDRVIGDSLGAPTNDVKVSIVTRIIQDETRDFFLGIPISSSDRGEGHYTGIYISPDHNLVFSNTGFGLEHNPYRIINEGSSLEKTQYLTVLHVKKPALADLVNPSTWQILLSSPSIQNVYDSIDALGAKGFCENPPDSDFERPQRGGSCGPQQLMAFFRHYILHELPSSLSEAYRMGIYKALKAELLICMGASRIDLVDPKIKEPLIKQLTKLEGDLALAYSLGDPELYAHARLTAKKKRNDLCI